MMSKLLIERLRKRAEVLLNRRSDDPEDRLIAHTLEEVADCILEAEEDEKDYLQGLGRGKG